MNPFLMRQNLRYRLFVLKSLVYELLGEQYAIDFFNTQHDIYKLLKEFDFSNIDSTELKSLADEMKELEKKIFSSFNKNDLIAAQKSYRNYELLSKEILSIQ